MSFEAASVLLVEDNLADVRMTVEILRGAKLANRLKVIGDGGEALAHLLATEEPPDLVLLDLDLPGVDGRSILTRVREEPRLRQVPVFVLTASATHSELIADEGLEADGYLIKPIDLGAFVRAACGLDHFWLELVCARKSN